MTFPTNLQPLLDGDILRYELGFAAETGWKAVTEDPEAIPPFDYVQDMLHQRIDGIKAMLHTTKDPIIYITEGRTFRDEIAQRKPYKGTRKENKPWHYSNLTAYLTGALGARVVSYIEADDALTIDHVSSRGTTVLCSRDKDLKQVPGFFYSWELGKQPSFGPALIDPIGGVAISENRKKLTGTGLSFFYAQVLTGDTVDNIPGLPGCGPVQALELLENKSPDDMLEAVTEAYREHYGPTWEEELLEQGRLCWMTRRLNGDRTPVLWEIGMIE